MKGYRRLNIKPGAPELAAYRKKREADRRFWRALQEVQAQRGSAAGEAADSSSESKPEEGKNE